MESSTRERLMTLVEQLAAPENISPDQKQLKELKKICRQSDDNVRYVFSLLMNRLCQEHAQVRLSCVRIIRELFDRSHTFRLSLCEDFQRFLQLTVTPDVDTPLPPPHNIAKLVIRETLQAVQEWKRTFGENYKQLDLGYHYLKHAKKIDFNSLTAETDAERARQQMEQERRQRRLTQQLNAVTSEMADMEHEINHCIQEMKSAFELLVPKPGSVFSQTDNSIISASQSVSSEEPRDMSSYKHQLEINRNEKPLSLGDKPAGSLEYPDKVSLGCPDKTDQESLTCEKTSKQLSGDDAEDINDIGAAEDMAEINDHIGISDSVSHDVDINFLQRHGMTSHHMPLVVSVISSDQGQLVVNESEDTQDIINLLRDNYKLVVNRFLLIVRKWLKVVGKCDDQSLLRKAIDIKELLIEAKEKFERIKFQTSRKDHPTMKLHPVESEEDSDDELFEELSPKSGVEETVVCDFDLERALAESQREISQNKPSQIIHKETDPTLPSSQSTTTQKQPNGNNLLPTTTTNTSKQDNIEPSDRKARLMLHAPVLRYDVDIQYNWNESQSDIPELYGNATGLGRAFTSPEGEGKAVSEMQLSGMKTRVIDFSGSFEPVKLTCRVPLPSGSLCPRQDRYTCPFHGKIIPRDANGKPLDDSNGKPLDDSNGKPLDDSEEEAQAQPQSQQTEISWEELESEVIAGAGVDMGSQRKRKSVSSKRGKKQCITQTNTDETSRSRLAKRIFNSASQTRVASALDEADRRRIQMKFGHQWNYRNHLT